MTILNHWLRDESGDDLMEYALLTATIGIGAAVALALMPGLLGALYASWDSGTQKIWDPCDPGAAKTCH